MPTPAELAEHTGAYVLPRPLYETIVTGDFTYVAGPRDAWVLDIRHANLDWARAESRRRGIPLVEWWSGGRLRRRWQTNCSPRGSCPTRTRLC